MQAPLLDVLRLAAACIVVWAHARAPGPYLKEMAVAIFAIALVYFAVGPGAGGGLPPGRRIALRARRLLWPFVGWAAVAVTMKAADAWIDGTPLWPDLRAWAPPQGSMAQLWFLPWAFAVNVLAILAAAAWGPVRLSTPAAAAAATAGVAAFAVAVSGLLAAGLAAGMLPRTSYLALLYLPAAAAGGLLAALGDRPTWIVAATAALILTATALEAAGLPGSQPLQLGLPMAAAALLWRPAAMAWTSRLRDVAMDIYLVHVAVLAVVAQTIGVGTATAALGALALSLPAALALPRIRAALPAGLGRFL